MDLDGRYGNSMTMLTGDDAKLTGNEANFVSFRRQADFAVGVCPLRYDLMLLLLLFLFSLSRFDVDFNSVPGQIISPTI